MARIVFSRKQNISPVPVAYQTVKSYINQFGVLWLFFPMKDKYWSWFATYWCKVYKLQLVWKHCWAGQQSIFKVKCGVNNLISSHDWIPGVPSVVLDLAAKFKPLVVQTQSVVFTRSSTDSQLTSSFWLSDELFVPSIDADFLHANPLKSSTALWMVLCPLFFPRLSWMLASLVTSCHT